MRFEELLVQFVLNSVLAAIALNDVGKNRRQFQQALQWIGHLQQALAIGDFLYELRRQQIGQVAGIGRDLHDLGFFIGHIHIGGVFLMQFLDVLHCAFGFVPIVWRLGDLLDLRHEERALVFDVGEANTANAFQHHLQVAAGHSLRADNAAEGGVLEKFVRPRVLDFLVFVGRNRDQMPGNGCFFHRMDTTRSTQLNGGHGTRENNVVAQGQQRNLMDGTRGDRSIGAHEAATPDTIRRAQPGGHCRWGGVRSALIVPQKRGGYRPGFA